MDQTFSYNEIGQLVGSTRQTTSYVYTYDVAGNRLARVVGATTYANTNAYTPARTRKSLTYG